MNTSAAITPEQLSQVVAELRTAIVELREAITALRNLRSMPAAPANILQQIIQRLTMKRYRSSIMRLSDDVVAAVVSRIIDRTVWDSEAFRWLCDQPGVSGVSDTSFYRFARRIRQVHAALLGDPPAAFEPIPDGDWIESAARALGVSRGHLRRRCRSELAAKGLAAFKRPAAGGVKRWYVAASMLPRDIVNTAHAPT